MKAGDLVSYSSRIGTRTTCIEGHGVVCRVSGDRVTIKTSDGKIEVSRGSCHREPTPTEIAAACEIIQAGWSDEERDRRRRHYAGERNRAAAQVDTPHYVVPTIRVAEIAVAG